MHCRHSTARFSAPSEVRVWGGFRSDAAVDSIGDSEKFTLEDQGDFTVCIKTFNGLYISTGEDRAAGLSYINRALKFGFRYST